MVVGEPVGFHRFPELDVRQLFFCFYMVFDQPFDGFSAHGGHGYDFEPGFEITRSSVRSAPDTPDIQVEVVPFDIPLRHGDTDLERGADGQGADRGDAEAFDRDIAHCSDHLGRIPVIDFERFHQCGAGQRPFVSSGLNSRGSKQGAAYVAVQFYEIGITRHGDAPEVGAPEVRIEMFSSEECSPEIGAGEVAFAAE
jgi:hypothetical protein